MKYFFVIVIYNKSCYESETCKRLQRYSRKENVVILDNSDTENQNREICEERNWIYIKMDGNQGISKAYNKAIDFLPINENDIIVWLDDDTFITEQYINMLKNEVEHKKDINIFMPIIEEFQGKIISPSIYTKIKNINIKNEQEINKIPDNRILGINTCLAVRGKIYKQYRYNENLFLDLVDNQFFYDMRKKEKMAIIPTIVKQNFFSSQKPSYESKIKRVKIEIGDYKIYAKDKSFLERIMCSIRICYWGIRGTIEYKKISFLKEVFNKYRSE